MQALSVITRLAAASSRAQEQIILEAYSSACFDFFECVRLAADPFISFGVHRVAEILEDDGAVGSFSFDEFRDLAERLRSRVLFGEAARLALHSAAERCHVATWNLLYRRILLKDLAVDLVMLRRVFRQLGADAARYQVPTFRCQIAQEVRSARTGTRLVDGKVDGTRLLSVLDGCVILHGADGKWIEHAAIERSLATLTHQLPGAIVLDGVMTAKGIYMVFDLIPLVEFRRGRSTKPQSARRAMLELLHRSGAFDTPSVRVLPQIEINFATDEGQTSFVGFQHQLQEDGFTSVVLKKPDAGYVGKRTSAWTIEKLSPAPTNT